MHALGAMLFFVSGKSEGINEGKLMGKVENMVFQEVIEIKLLMACSAKFKRAWE